MSEWQDVFGSNYEPWKRWEQDYLWEQRSNVINSYLSAGYKTCAEWNALGKKIKNGERGKYGYFSEAQTEPSYFSKGHPNKKIYKKKYRNKKKKEFANFIFAKKWAVANPGKIIMYSSRDKVYYELKQTYTDKIIYDKSRAY